ncbi:lipase family protein [Chryseobacterium viscerum]|uniref:Alpha/beta hydrolase n=1 Tax=Chryseobacterium viscerum TaxID=1037377 RepID=A0A5N4BSG3_9FLAO|nr:hypothetical protein [Chryseobacterium viscerum]KAB1231414.1 hypothetical protein F8D52_06290 [Chryseobacterium viscerum]
MLDIWTKNLKKSFENAGISYPENLKIKMPHYGMELIELRDNYRKDLKKGKFQMRAATDSESLDEFDNLHLELLDDLRRNAGITSEEVSEALGESEQQRGWKNNKYILKLSKYLDEKNKKFSNGILHWQTSDVVTYLIVPKAKKIINSYFVEVLDKQPTIIVAHSLGTIIAYDILHNLKRENYDIRGLITLGSPLGVHSVIRQLYPPPAFPQVIKGNWTNIYDKYDIVSLRPLNGGHFRVDPEIINQEVLNTTDDRHGIEGYLSNPLISRIILGIMIRNVP